MSLSNNRQAAECVGGVVVVLSNLQLLGADMLSSGAVKCLRLGRAAFLNGCVSTAKEIMRVLETMIVNSLPQYLFKDRSRPPALFDCSNIPVECLTV